MRDITRIEPFMQEFYTHWDSTLTFVQFLNQILRQRAEKDRGTDPFFYEENKWLGLIRMTPIMLPGTQKNLLHADLCLQMIDIWECVPDLRFWQVINFIYGEMDDGFTDEEKATDEALFNACESLRMQLKESKKH